MYLDDDYIYINRDGSNEREFVFPIQKQKKHV